MNLNQTLQEKYPHLEVSVLKLSEVKKNIDFRIDDSFWTMKLIYNNKLNYKKIGECLLKSQYGISINMNEEGDGVPIYRMNDIDNMLCNFEVKKYALIDKNELQTFRLNYGDVLFNRTNSYEFVGRTGIFYNNRENFVFASYLVRLVCNKEILLPEYLTVFLNTHIGKKEIRRRARPSINQTNVNPEELKEIKIPIFPMEFQLEIQNLVKDSHKALEESKELYKKAEETLYLELGLDPKNPLQSLLDSKIDHSIKSLNISIRTLKESFLKTGRLDSEYYQSKYEDIEKFIKSYPNGYDSFSSIINNKDTNFTPKNNENYSYIELANIGNNGNISEPISDLGKNLPTRARRIVSKGDVIISSIEGSLSSCALITQEFDKHLVSTGFFVLNSKLLNGETLLVMFKSQIFQEYLKKFPSGTILCAINKEELSKILIPKIDSTTQEKIAKYIQESFNLRKKSKQLLDNAKIKVEEQIQGKI
ncbi:restriction endonuclease subunit S [Campylobacter jejuni]|uniref:restriction endonuclease subunit S n=1 Tax=Campylobacter jejuni TaxID=197 RepID=UPI0004590D55|nr:restriction endonuclease subunit S [Campylobacter jejuni]ECP9108751.1 restriction endonuclease subunit S [Campylobacter coli]AON67211.1 putative DNA methylase-type I restriction-modification system [Campylobacter jejuni subsp. jejuni]EAB5413707.1 restriction endonuclease subunit S [Campylobacter jejuni]EAC1613164.1 restriction endonuclease subunit S [Campylobacter jejuni]EAH4641353.1 restriction endonuclease subunit S [Campylobacter jejuni]